MLNGLIRGIFYILFFGWIVYINFTGESHLIELFILIIGTLYAIWAILWEVEHAKNKKRYNRYNFDDFYY